MASENGQEKRDTLAEVVEEMRTRSREVKEAFGGRPDGVENMLDIWADRIEAIDSADAWRSLYDPGSSAAMREALMWADKFISVVGEWLKDHDEVGDYALAAGVTKTLVERALSAPARNCDLKECSTDEGVISAHERFCESWHDDGKTCAECPYNPRSQMMTCREKWLLAPAAEREGDGDGR